MTYSIPSKQYNILTTTLYHLPYIYPLPYFVSTAFLPPYLQEICDRYFLPLIQLLSSQTTFPGGGKARAAICESMVKLLISLGEQLGREQACNLLGSTLQCFFASFSGVHQEERRASSSSNVTGAPNGHIEPELASTPVSSSLKHTGGGSTSRPEAKTVEFHPLTEPVEKEGSNLLDSEAYQQLCATFSKPMAHSAYVIFCKLLGQIYLQDCLYNSELIEQLAYTHDKVRSMKCVYLKDTIIAGT